MGSFRCIKCEKIYYLQIFGFGTCICPNCYRGETKFISFDKSYILNRILSRLITSNIIIKSKIEYDPLLITQQNNIYKELNNTY